MADSQDASRRTGEFRSRMNRCQTRLDSLDLLLSEGRAEIPESFLELLAELGAAARQCGDHEVAVRVERVGCEEALARGDLTQAEQHVRVIAEIARQSGNPRHEGSGYYLAGRVSRAHGDFDQAQLHYERARGEWQAAGSDDGVRETLEQLGSMFMERGMPSAALGYYAEYAEVRPERLDERSLALNLHQRARAEVQLGRWEDAAEHLYRAVVMAERIGDQAVRYGVLCTQGLLFLRRDRSERAVHLLTRVVEAGRRGDAAPETMFDALVHLGEACLRLGDVAGAQRAFSECAVCCDRMADVRGQVRLQWHTAELLLAKGRAAEAETAARGAFQLAQQQGFRLEIGESLRVLALTAAASGDRDGADSYFERGIHALKAADESYELARAQLQFGQHLAQEGRKSEAVSHLKEAVRMFRDLSIVTMADDTSRLLLRLETHADADVALMAAIAGLASLGLEPREFLDRSLRLLREELGHDGVALITDRAVIAADGRVALDRARACLARANGDVCIGGQELCVPVRFGGTTLAAICATSEQPLPGRDNALVLQTVANLIAGPVQDVLAVPAGIEPASCDIAGLRYRGVVGRSPGMVRSLRVVAKVAGTSVPVLIRGESGTGKELVARALHESGSRAGRPFVAVNCAAMPENLLEAEFFGVEKGAATGVVARKGKFEVADGGTVFLDEIGDMSPALQAKLLRVLQEKEFERVGGRQLIRVDVRVVAATNQQLEERMERGQFRRDLYYRLNAVELTLPALRDRKEDIPELVRYFVARSAQEYGCRVRSAGQEVMQCFTSYSWPGNIRELQNVIERAVVLCQGDELQVADLPPELQGCRAGRPAAAQLLRDVRKQAQDRAAAEVERASLLAFLDRAGGNASKAAALSGYSRAQFYRLLKKHDIGR